MIAQWNYFEDQTYVSLVLHKYWHEAETEETEWVYDSYLISYYKDRGKTDVILLNGIQVNFDEYIHLLNVIEASGFKFDLKN